MWTVGPAQSVDPRVVIRECRLQLRRICSKGESAELKPVDIGIAGLSVHSGGSRQVDADLRIGDRRFVVQLVADDVHAKAKVVDQAVVEYVSFGDAAEPAVQRNAQREVEVVGTGLASGLDAVRIGSERFEGAGIGPEKAFGEMIFPAAEFAIPVHRELVIGE